MDFGVGTYLLAILAGLLTTLSPCVLPILPILLAAALDAHRWGIWLLALGLSLSFTLAGLFVATAGVALGLDAASFRVGGAVLLMLFGSVLLSSALQQRFAAAAGGLSNLGMSLLDKLKPGGLGGQFFIGAILGLVWAPCVGPTLGAASTLAAQGRQLPQVALLMLVFGLSAGLPLIVLGSLSRRLLIRLRHRLLRAGALGKTIFGAILFLFGLLMASGLEKPIEAYLLDISPEWLTVLTTRF